MEYLYVKIYPAVNEYKANHILHTNRNTMPSPRLWPLLCLRFIWIVAAYKKIACGENINIKLNTSKYFRVM